MVKIIAYCGMDCAACPAYIATMNNDDKMRAQVAEGFNQKLGPVFGVKYTAKDINCDGCTKGKRLIHHCEACAVRKCASGKKMENCAKCGSYICDALGQFYKLAPPEAKQNLDAIHNKKK